MLERIRRGEKPQHPLPDFHGSEPALRGWLADNYGPSAVSSLTTADWLILAAYLKAEEDLRKVLRKLGADEQRSMKRITEAK